MQKSNSSIVLSKAELEFIEDLKKGDVSKYKPVYARTEKGLPVAPIEIKEATTA